MKVGDRIHITIKELYSVLLPTSIKHDIELNKGYYIVDRVHSNFRIYVRGCTTCHIWLMTTNYYDIRVNEMEHDLPEELFNI